MLPDHPNLDKDYFRESELSYLTDAIDACVFAEIEHKKLKWVRAQKAEIELVQADIRALRMGFFMSHNIRKIARHTSHIEEKIRTTVERKITAQLRRRKNPAAYLRKLTISQIEHGRKYRELAIREQIKNEEFVRGRKIPKNRAKRMWLALFGARRYPRESGSLIMGGSAIAGAGALAYLRERHKSDDGFFGDLFSFGRHNKLDNEFSTSGNSISREQLFASNPLNSLTTNPNSLAGLEPSTGNPAINNLSATKTSELNDDLYKADSRYSLATNNPGYGSENYANRLEEAPGQLGLDVGSPLHRNRINNSDLASNITKGGFFSEMFDSFFKKEETDNNSEGSTGGTTGTTGTASGGTAGTGETSEGSGSSSNNSSGSTASGSNSSTSGGSNTANSSSGSTSGSTANNTSGSTSGNTGSTANNTSGSGATGATGTTGNNGNVATGGSGNANSGSNSTNAVVAGGTPVANPVKGVDGIPVGTQTTVPSQAQVAAVTNQKNEVIAAMTQAQTGQLAQTGQQQAAGQIAATGQAGQAGQVAATGQAAAQNAQTAATGQTGNTAQGAANLAANAQGASTNATSQTAATGPNAAVATATGKDGAAANAISNSALTGKEGLASATATNVAATGKDTAIPTNATANNNTVNTNVATGKETAPANSVAATTPIKETATAAVPTDKIAPAQPKIEAPVTPQAPSKSEVASNVNSQTSQPAPTATTAQTSGQSSNNQGVNSQSAASQNLSTASSSGINSQSQSQATASLKTETPSPASTLAKAETPVAPVDKSAPAASKSELVPATPSINSVEKPVEKTTAQTEAPKADNVIKGEFGKGNNQTAEVTPNTPASAEQPKNVTPERPREVAATDTSMKPAADKVQTPAPAVPALSEKSMPAVANITPAAGKEGAKPAADVSKQPAPQPEALPKVASTDSSATKGNPAQKELPDSLKNMSPESLGKVASTGNNLKGTGVELSPTAQPVIAPTVVDPNLTKGSPQVVV